MWHLGISDMPGRPYAVVDGEGQLAGCHSSREAATIQMTALNMDGITSVEEIEPSAARSAPPKKVAPPEPPRAPRKRDPVAFSTPTTLAW